ncbi:MAG: YicC/YloC family endoribonuclease, partial [Puniceicoccales bacterium]
MTGYGRGAASDSRLDLTIELASVNRKGLEVSASLPREWQGMERELTDKVRAAVGRGKVTLSVTVKDLATAEGLNWDNNQVKATVERMRALSLEIGSTLQLDGQTLLGIINELKGSGELPSWEEALPLAQKALAEGLKAFNDMRATEGAALQQDILSRLAQIRTWCGEISKAFEGTVPRYRELLLERLQKANLELDISDERVLKEIALFADRCDITEELTRLESHLTQFEETLSANEPIGRKLDFLCQELYRETNTVGSKANNIDITRLVIEIKNELERVREQVQNIE